jgi:hypothetical protein
MWRLSCITRVRRIYGAFADEYDERNVPYGLRTSSRSQQVMYPWRIFFGIVLPLLPSTMSDHMEDAVLCAALVAPLILVLGLIVATNIELKKLDRSPGDWRADPEEIT